MLTLQASQFLPSDANGETIGALSIRNQSGLTLGRSGETRFYTAGNGDRLHQVKIRRNNLAHGNTSFSECGREFTYEDLYLLPSESASIFL